MRLVLFDDRHSMRPMSAPAPLVVPPSIARRFARRVLGFDQPHRDVASALAYHGYIQIDPINICGRMHDLILRNRVTGYREGDLMRHLHGDSSAEAGDTDDATAVGRETGPRRSARRAKPAESRTAFEHHVPDSGNLVAFPLEAWPHLQLAMRQRTRRTSAWSGRLTPRERELAPRLLEEIGARGPLAADDFEDARRAHRVVWGAASLVKSTLQKLFFHGRLLIAQRSNNRRRYDLPERVLPATVLAQPACTETETARWLVLLKLRQRRLVLLKRDELPLVADLVQAVDVPGCPRLHCLRSDLPQWEQAMANAGEADADAGHVAPRLLAPLDPLIYDRRVTAALWNFDYAWEAYTPARKRVRGYYALPVLAGTEIVGHVDPKADRPARRLRVMSRRIRRGHQVAPTVRDLARWLGLR